MQNGDLQQYLDPAVLTRIQRLDLRTRLVVEGFISGRHRSPFHGLSVEFAQHRQYVPGDDIKRIDWKVWSRSDRYMVKQYEEETNLRATFVVDVSESMRYGGAGREARLSKFEYAGCVTAALAMLALRNQDAVALATFDDALRAYLPASSNPVHIRALIRELEQVSLNAKTQAASVLGTIADTVPRRGLVCLVSDLLVDPDDLQEGLRALQQRGHDVMVLHVMDQDELTFPFRGNTRFVGLEGEGEFTGDPQIMQQVYLDELDRFLQRVRRTCIACGIQYRLLSTAENLGAALSAFLSARNEMQRLAPHRGQRGSGGRS